MINLQKEEKEIKADEQWALAERFKFLKIEKKHFKLLFILKVSITVSFFATQFLTPTQAAWVMGATNLLWLWEL